MNFQNIVSRSVVAGLAVLAFSQAALADSDSREIGEVTTAIKLFSSHKLKVVAFNDPEVKGVTCWLSRPVKGGLSGAFGVADEKSNASIACRQTGPIEVTGDLAKSAKGEEVFNERRSVWFKELHVTRFFDEAAKTLVYLTWSDKLIDGSPKNSLSTVVMRPWQTGGIQPVLTKPER